MTNTYYQTELNLLHELAAEFASANPALAPLLDGNRTDPDVERLLEAVAFQNAMLRRKLACDFPELIHKLVHLILPHYLRPIPATTIVGFTSHAGQGQSAIIPAGTLIASAPVDGTACRFATCADVAVHPLEIITATYVQHASVNGEIRLSLALNGLELSHWQPKTLRLFLAGDYASASELYLLLCRHVSRIVLTPADGGSSVVLPADCLRAVGFDEGEELLPYPPHAFSGYRLLQEYFSTPEKFLFLDLVGWERWLQRGDGTDFSISIELERLPSGTPRFRHDSIALNAVPAVNLFPHDADPIYVNHRAGCYQVRPAGLIPDHYPIYSVDRVTGYTRSNQTERNYVPFEMFSNSSEPAYHTVLTHSRLQNSYDVQLGVSFPGEIPPPEVESLSIALTCTNGSLPENLRIGDITCPLSAVPDFISVRNITPINPGQLLPLGPDLLWQFTTHLYLNHLSLECAEHLRTLLELYVFPGQGSWSAATANQKRISGIETVEITAGEQFVEGVPLRGREIRMKVRQNHFAGSGDMFLFGCVLDQFLGRYASLNCYTRLMFHESLRGGTCQWPLRLGTQPLPC